MGPFGPATTAPLSLSQTSSQSRPRCAISPRFRTRIKVLGVAGESLVPHRTHHVRGFLPPPCHPLPHLKAPALLSKPLDASGGREYYSSPRQRTANRSWNYEVLGEVRAYPRALIVTDRVTELGSLNPLVTNSNRALKQDWSGRRGSNSRPLPWQGSALPLSYSRSRAGRRVYPLAKPLAPSHTRSGRQI